MEWLIDFIHNKIFIASMILPGQTIGILGGGQLGRMFAIAARRMGFRVHSLDPQSDCPTGQVADLEIVANYDDLDAARRFAFGVDVVTFEFENVPAGTLAAIEEIRPVHPSPHVLDTCRHRLREKDFLSVHRFPVTHYRRADSLEDLKIAVAEMGANVILKSAEYGYDGKGQARISSEADDLAAAWQRMGQSVGIVEKIVDFEREISVVCARSASGETRCFRPFENAHRDGILDVTICPARIDESMERAAIELATNVAHALELVGVMAVEMFVSRDGQLLVNELAPRPHNSGHLTIDACITCQFEQQVRAVCGLPLGNTDLLRPAAMANLLGDLWQSREPNWNAALATNDAVKLHLYGKQQPKRGRKMGHINATAENVETARNLVTAARAALGTSSSAHV